MPYDMKAELKRVKEYYNNDPLQKRFSAIITGETNAGKTYILRSARFPIHIDSFDPGGTKCLSDLIEKGHVVADTQWENEDPFEPKVFEEWMKATTIRLKTGYFSMFGTYCIDSLSTFGDAVMNHQLHSDGMAGKPPRRNRDYVPQKVFVVNYIKQLMNLTCDFILTGHLREHEDIISIDKKTGIVKKNIKYRLNVTGDAVITLPLLFDELYVILGESPRGGGEPKRKMLVDALGTYVARSRLKRDGKLDAIEEPNIRKILKKIGLKWEDKPRLEIE